MADSVLVVADSVVVVANTLFVVADSALVVADSVFAVADPVFVLSIFLLSSFAPILCSRLLYLFRDVAICFTLTTLPCLHWHAAYTDIHTCAGSVASILLISPR